MKVLIVKMSSMGDVIHALPAVSDALKADPGISFDWCVEPAFADIAALHPGVRKLHRLALRRFVRAPFGAGHLREIRATICAMRAERYDVVLDAQGLFKSASVAWLAGRPVAGLDRSSAREGLAASAFYGRRHHVPRGRHAIWRNRALFASAFGYEPDYSRTDFGISSGEPHDQRTVFLLHGTSWSSKRWPDEAWIEVSRGVSQRGLTPVVTWADEAEADVATRIADANPDVRVIPKSPIGEVAAQLARACGAVGTDTGLTNLAGAFGLPTVAIFLSTSPELTGPAGPHAETVQAVFHCAPCRERTCRLAAPGDDQPCAATVSPEQVLARLDDLMAARALPIPAPI